MDSLIYTIFTIYYILLLFFGMYHSQNKKLYSIFLPLVTLGLIYDNLVIVLGQYIGVGPFLVGLNAIRYWIHAFFTPTLILFSMNAVRKTNTKWSQHPLFPIIAWLYSIFLILLELFTETFGLKIMPKWEYGVLHYVPEEPSGIPLMIVGLVIWILISSIIIWQKQRWIWMFIGTLIMLIGSSVPLNINSSAIMNGFELLFITSLWATKLYLIKDTVKIKG